MKHKIPPNKWIEGVPPNDGRKYSTYSSPIGYSYYRPNGDVVVWASAESAASLAVVGVGVVELTRNELLQLKLEIDKVYKEIDT